MKDREMAVVTAQLSLERAKHEQSVARAEYTVAARRLALAGEHVGNLREYLDRIRNP
jgi:hypothetical protein